MAKGKKLNTNLENVVQLVSRESAISEFGESVASFISKDAMVSWMKFILTDDMPNKNGERIPESEFDNLIKTGFYKPIKMMVGDINDGHDDAEPIGVITNLARNGNQIVALAALWPTERAEDVQLLKDRVESGKPVNVSWEIFYGDRTTNGGVVDLLDTTLRAVTIVGIPAYAGRTPVLAIAANKWSDEYVSNLPDANFILVTEDGKRLFPFMDAEGKISPYRFNNLEQEISASDLSDDLKSTAMQRIDKVKSALASSEERNLEVELDKIKELEDKVVELSASLDAANGRIAELESSNSSFASESESNLAAKDEEINTLKTSLASLTEEVEGLRAFKSDIDAKVEKESKLSEIKTKFQEAGLEKPESFFEENSEKLLSLDGAGLEFMLQELVAFSSTEGNTSSASSRGSLPNFTGESGKLTISELAQALRAKRTK
jgi:hypothetical protein